jgi:hypothetical protein
VPPPGVEMMGAQVLTSLSAFGPTQLFGRSPSAAIKGLKLLANKTLDFTDNICAITMDE